MEKGLNELKRLREFGDSKALNVNVGKLYEIFNKIKTDYFTTSSSIDNNYFTLIENIRKIFIDAGFDLSSKEDSLTYFSIVEYELASFFKK